MCRRDIKHPQLLLVLMLTQAKEGSFTVLTCLSFPDFYDFFPAKQTNTHIIFTHPPSVCTCPPFFCFLLSQRPGPNTTVCKEHENKCRKVLKARTQKITQTHTPNLHFFCHERSHAFVCSPLNKQVEVK